MKCNSCNNIINYGYTVCPYCGEYVQYSNQNNNINNNIKKNNKMLYDNVFYSNLAVLLLNSFIFISIILLVTIDTFNEMASMNFGSGFFILLFPLVIIIYTLPYIIGVVLSIIQLFVKKQFMNLLILIFSIIGNIMMIKLFELNFDNIINLFFVIIFVCSIALSLILIVKLIFKK